MQRLIGAAQVCFYTLLYAIKLSLLSLYRHLLHGLPALYRRIWLFIVVFCVLSWAGSLISMFVTCTDIKAQFKDGICGRAEGEIMRIRISLYLSYALDVLTDIMVMALPIRLTWGLQMERGQRVGLSVLFGSGLIVVVFATLRVVKVGIEPNADRGSVSIPIYSSLFQGDEVLTHTAARAQMAHPLHRPRNHHRRHRRLLPRLRRSHSQ